MRKCLSHFSKIFSTRVKNLVIFQRFFNLRNFVKWLSFLRKLKNLWKMTKFFTRVEKIFENDKDIYARCYTFYGSLKFNFLSFSRGEWNFRRNETMRHFSATHQLIPKLRFMYVILSNFNVDCLQLFQFALSY